MQIKYRTEYWEVLPKGVVKKIKRLQRIGKDQISNKWEEELRKRLFDDSLDLRLKKEGISAIVRSQLGRNDSGEVNAGNLDSKTIEFLKKKSIQVDCLGNLISSDSKYWFSHPQTYDYSLSNQRLHRQLPHWNMMYVLTHLFIPGISGELLYTPLIADAPKTIKERVTSDIEWMINNQCAMGVSRHDLFHAHICFELGNNHFRSEAVHNANQLVESMQGNFPVLLTTRSITTPFFREYKRKLHSLYGALFGNFDTMLILYHSYEHVNCNHPCYINRTVLTKNSNRFCVIPVLDNLGVGADEINGISGLSVALYFRINPNRGKTDRDLKNLEIYVTPPVLRGL